MTADLVLYPAIDLKDGRCVRLLHGDMAAETIYNDDPGDQARQFANAGFSRLHVVDLNGAFTGRSENAFAVETIRAATGVRMQLGGGVRTRADIAMWLDKGVDRVILGTAAVRDPDLVREAAAAHPGRIAVGIDARDGEVRTEGWAEGSGEDAVSLAKRFEDAGVAAIIYTDIGRDGALAGVNVDATARLAEAVSTPVIASGGVAGLADIEALSAAHAIEGVVIGRALYDGRLDPAAARAAARRTAG
ncbi:MAG: 1-(5-phosphoribosyl)-5-[(5-phosphoribosylamino)methylideneamino]imidazole-4-carboxamide isomerase [Pseudomonadota bacterium]